MDAFGTTVDDTTLVQRVLAQDPAAFAAMYDRYAAQIYAMSSRLLADPHEAEDVTSEVFLAAAERLGTLRDRSRLRAWLFAIARNQIYTRSERRARLVPHADLPLEVDLEADDANGGHLGDTPDLAGLIQAAAKGLDDRDRTVLELHLAGGLDGEDLADALDVSVANAYQLTHRMKERLATSVGTLLVARRGSDDCPSLATMLAEWDGVFSVLWRKRISRHISGCETCETKRRAVPASIFADDSVAAALVASRSPLPAGLRDRVLGRVARGDRLRATTRWRPDGFPTDHRPRRRGLLLLPPLAALALIVGGGVWLVGGETSDITTAGSRTATTASTVRRADAAPGITTSTFADSTTMSSPLTSDTAETTTTVLTIDEVGPEDSPPTAPLPVPIRPTGSNPTTPSSQPATASSTSPPSVSVTSPPDVTPPTVAMGVPTFLVHSDDPNCSGQQPITALVSDAGAITSVTLKIVNGSKTSTPAMTRNAGLWSYVPQIPTAGSAASVTLQVIAADAAGNVGSSNKVVKAFSICVG